ncbi:hypothetical protein J2W40_002202 [Sphingobium xenophagum]|uniref:Uncharacterized protein n=1 Tax=Sphingobium xenophagum TaxID=121428 RepID=A0ABU1X1D1_SPHXE|nr:hypothetical protein [Sphingobium xenophagum]MDR7155375.1 hypothetical protein [Sphingobium xenophagum]
MPVVTAPRADSAANRKGRPGKSSPFKIDHNDAIKDKATDWRAQLLMQRHHVTSRIGDLILALHFGEVRDAE